MNVRQEAADNGRRRVLVVDDEADIRELLDLTLARMGLDADCAASLAEARERLATRPLPVVPDRYALAGRRGPGAGARDQSERR